MNKDNKENLPPSKKIDPPLPNKSLGPLNNQIPKKKRLSLNTSLIMEYENIADKAVDLIFNNVLPLFKQKINSKNAFDVNVSFLENLPHLINQNIESSWQKASASLDASAKIYGYRVDSVHTETFKFLGGLNRAEQKNDEENNLKENEERKREKKVSSNKDGESTLEKDISKLNVEKFDLAFEVDALFKNMTAKFSDSGARGSILKTLPMNQSLNIMLESSTCETQGRNEDAQISHKAPKSKKEEMKTISAIVEKSLVDFNIRDLKNKEVCPDLMMFKESRRLEIPSINSDMTFIDNLIEQEMHTQEALKLDDSADIGESEQSMMFDEFSKNPAATSPVESSEADVQLFDENFIQNNVSLNKNFSRIEGFSYIRNEDIKQFISNFGDGNKDILKKYFNDPKQFENQMRFKVEQEKRTKGEKKNKKEEKLFEFSRDNLIKQNEVFDDSKGRLKKVPIAPTKKENKRKAKEFFYYDRTHLFNLFTFENVIQNESNMLKQIKEEHENSNPNFKQNQSQNGDVYDDADVLQNQSNYDIKRFNEKENENINQFDKKFGKLYKTFDVGLVKRRIWDTITEIKGNSKNLSFETLIERIGDNVDTNTLENISTSTCFVCLLHLANEKSNRLI